MSHDTATGAPVKAPLDNNGRMALYDAEGYRVPWIDIPDELYFPDQSIFEPTVEEREAACRVLYDDAESPLRRAARKVIWAAIEDFVHDRPLPAATDEAIEEMDALLNSLEPIALADHEPSREELERWEERLAQFNRERTDEPYRESPMWGYE